MMKILTISDVHGRTDWKQQVGDVEQWDLIIFLGDYVDSYDIPTNLILENLANIIEFKKSNMDKVILLLGNHCIQYVWPNEGFGCSGYKGIMLFSYGMLFNENLHLFQVAYQIDNYIWTHAGIVNEWYQKHVHDKPEIEGITISDKLNFMMHRATSRAALFVVGVKRGGFFPYGGIVWADELETKRDPLLGYHQIVGHTPQKDINTLSKNNETSVTYTDLHSLKPYILEI